MSTTFSKQRNMFAFKIQINCLQNKQIWISLLFKFATNGKNNLKNF